ncbi:unnamed protein product [Rotaria magnacalcarata]|uniref:B box-type domain-containing protein n=1 Tax=Rotaria magnacalcarata TaxID=392030 RepID=A0A820H0W9_9BILA|nr:unnamed protein product [Rotaria magnacalcarata]CAF2159524.1 unnamed protein product [Rotaria magnacalcarata]CAF3974488.1 unnamed protein product [Rotaria magnacalcarata]CAF4288351.1 unnamed protein product [Rotaria magnacalcarata]
MSHSSVPKVPCVTCDRNGMGIFKCEGCAQVFCRKHSTEHRDRLTHQLDELVIEHDALQKSIAEHNDEQNTYQQLLEKINTWERDAIAKIQRTANEARQQVNKLTNEKTEIVSMKLNDLAQRVRKARTDDDYVETDLEKWIKKLKGIKNEMITILGSITVVEDSKNALVPKISISSIQQPAKFEERFVECLGNVTIEDNGRSIAHSSSKRSDAYARAAGEYSHGKRRIRLIINKTASYVASFNVVSKSVRTLGLSPSNGCFPYGWRTDDSMNNPDIDRKTNPGQKDLRGETTLKLDLLIDCDNRKISYFNEHTKITRTMDVDINRCPFPWQLECHVHDVNDRIEILSSNLV